MDNLKVVILAAGKGTRLQSDEILLPKPMRKVAGKHILSYVLNSVDFIDKKDIIIVVGYMRDMIIEAFPEYKYAIQDDENSLGYGTGAAVRYAEHLIGDYSGDILVLMGDMPLVTRETILELYDIHKNNNNDCTNLSCEVNDIINIGRIVRDKNGNFQEIVENKDATEEQKQNIKEYNSGNAIFNSKKLFEQLANLKNNNKSKEYYLTDIPKIFREHNYKVGAYKSKNGNEIHGANSMEELELIENILRNNSTK